MNTVVDAPARTLDASWWACGADRWLEVVVARKRGGVTDGSSAQDFVGAASWEHGDRVFLCEADADRWIIASGLVEQDLASRRMTRRPDGYASVRDPLAAAAAAGDPDAERRFFARLESEQCAPADLDGLPAWLVDAPPAEPPTDVEDAVAVVAVAPCRMGKAERREQNRRLAAELRALGLVPNGSVWAQAKALMAAGAPLTREAVAA